MSNKTNNKTSNKTYTNDELQESRTISINIFGNNDKVHGFINLSILKDRVPTSSIDSVMSKYINLIEKASFGDEDAMRTFFQTITVKEPSSTEFEDFDNLDF